MANLVRFQGCFYLKHCVQSVRFISGTRFSFQICCKIGIWERGGYPECAYAHFISWRRRDTKGSYNFLVYICSPHTIYKCPSNDIQKLTNKIWELNIKKQQGKSRAGVQESATKLWHAKYKNDRRSLAEFMSQDSEVESKQSILKYVKKYV